RRAAGGKRRAAGGANAGSKPLARDPSDSYVARMHISFALFADAANLSQEGKLNILGVFDALQVAGLPAVHPRASLVCRLKGDRSDAGLHRLTLRWLDPHGAEVWSTTGELNVGEPPPGVPEMDLPIIAAVDLPISHAGRHIMRIVLDDEPKADISLHVRAAAKVPAPRTGGMVS
ncbi:MAG: DUF6941 family protein, partial [Gemmatimonadaceae bacterium]